MIYRFKNYELDEQRRELRGPAGAIDTEPKVFELLLYLIRHRDRAVSKDELLNELWPRTIVTETALTRCVMKARRAIGDDSDMQAAILTVHSHGYRFVAELEPEQVATAEVQSSALPERRAPWLIAVLLALVLGIAAVLFLRPDSEQIPEAGALAVLPVNNLVDDPELGWVRIGLMSLVKRMLEDDGVSVVAENRVLSVLADTTLDSPPDEALFARIRTQTGAASSLYTTLETQGGLYKFSAVITSPDGRKLQRMIVGDSPAGLAADMARVVAGVLSGAEVHPVNRFSKTSTDPFVNEMYARALDLELQGELEEARRLFRVASDLEPELFWLRYEIALCTRDLREWDAAEILFDALHEEARAASDARALIATLNSQGVMHFNRNDYDGAERLYRQALAAASQRRHASDRALINVNLGLIAVHRGDLSLAQQQYEAALQSYSDADEEPAPSFHNNFAGLLLKLGELDRARQHSELAIEGFRLRGQRRFEAPSLNRLAAILRRLGDFDGAILRHEQSAAIYRDLGDTDGEISAQSGMTAIFRQQGDLTRAALNARDITARVAASDDALLKADAYLQSAYINAELDKYSNALADFESARDLFAAVGEEGGLRSTEFGLAGLAIDTGDTALARTIAVAQLQSARTAANEAAAARAQLLLGRIAAAEGDLITATDQYRAVLDYARGGSDVFVLVEAGTRLAGVELSRSNLGAATALIEEIRTAAAAAFDFLRMDAQLALARGDKAAAIEILSTLRKRAGESWRASDEELLRSLQP